MKKRFISLLLTCSMVVGLLAAGTPALAEETGDNVVYMNSGPLEFVEIPWYNCGEYSTHRLLFETLLGIDANFDITTDSGMAESYELSDDMMTLTLTLRDGLKWHDGEDVTVDDVVWSIETATDPTITIKEIIKTTLQSIEGYEEFAAGTEEHMSGITTDGNTITIQFSEVAPDVMISMGLFAILPKHCLEDADVTQFQQDSFWQSPIGSGPFMVDEVDVGNYMTLVPFEDYWGGVADFTVYCSASSAESDSNLVTNALAGKIDYAFTKNYADVQALRDEEGINIITVPVMYTRWLTLNEYPYEEGGTGTFSDARVRQAIAYAIDRDLICESIFEGACDPGTGTLLPTGMAMKNEDVENYEYNPEKAKELLEEAGWDSSYTVKMVYYYDDEQTKDLVSVIQQELAEVGINIDPQLLTGDYSSLLNVPPTSTDENGISGIDFDMCYGALSAVSVTDYYNRFASWSPANYYVPANPEMEEMLDALNATADPDEQKDIVYDIEAYQAENMLYVPLYYQPAWVIASDKVVDNVETWGNPQYFWDWDIQNWTLAY